MKRMQVVLLAAAGCLCFASLAAAQLGMNIFKKPNIADIFKPVVGSGALYEQQRTDQQNAPKTTMEMTVVGKEMVDGREGYWMEVGHTESNTGQIGYGKMLVTKDDFQFHRMIVQQPGQPAMEFPFNPSDKTRSHMTEEMDKWHSVGTETITVPAGTFSCQHWKKDQGVGDVWASDKVSPIGMVKSVSPGETMVLVKVLTNVTDHITGPVTKFDPEAMRKQMMEQMQQQKPKP
jgi:hypothetical protein